MAVLASHRARATRSPGSSLDRFEQVYRDNVDAVIGYFAARREDPHTVADLTYETFATAAKAFASFDPRRMPARDWLLRIAAELLASGDSTMDARHRELDDDELAALSARIETEHAASSRQRGSRPRFTRRKPRG